MASTHETGAMRHHPAWGDIEGQHAQQHVSAGVAERMMRSTAVCAETCDLLNRCCDVRCNQDRVCAGRPNACQCEFAAVWPSAAAARFIVDVVNGVTFDTDFGFRPSETFDRQA